MKRMFTCLLALVLGAPALASKTKANAGVTPLETVIHLMDDLAAKVRKEGEEEDKAYGEFFEWCDDTATTLSQEIKTYSAKKGKLEAKIVELTEDSEACTTKIEDLTGRIGENEKDLKDATLVFEKEQADFEGNEKVLMDSIDTMSRAITTLEKEMSKAPGSFAQLDFSGLTDLLNTLSVINDAAAFNAADKQKIASLLQAEADADDEDAGAPKAANYESKSGAIVDVLEDLKEKAETSLDALRLDFTKTKQEFNMMKQSLEAALSEDNKNLAAEKNANAQAKEGKSTAETDLATTTKLLKDSTMGLATTQHDCMVTAADHDASQKSRKEELKVIAEAKKIVTEAFEFLQKPSQSTADSAGDDDEDDQDQPESFLQVSEKSLSKYKKHLAAAAKKVVGMVQKLAHDHHSKSLAQLASRIDATMQFGGGANGSPFAKVTGMLNAMINKLEKEQEESAAEKAYCDEQMSKTEEKKSDLSDDVDKLKVQIDEASSASAGLKEDVNKLQEELASLAKEQGELDRIRGESHKVYLKSKEELEKGLKGIRKALSVLREYYGGAAASAAMLQEGVGQYMSAQMKQPKMPASHGAAGGAGGSIISILEVCESDLATNLADVEKLEADEVAEHEGLTQENELTKKTKEQDVKYKTQQFKGLDNSLAEMSEDLKGTQTELDTVLEYYEKVKQRCVAKPEPYEERVKRRNAEIKGLRAALATLGNEEALLQLARRKNSHKKHFLGF